MPNNVMSRKQVGRNTGQSGRNNLSWSELDERGVSIDDTIDVDVCDAKEVGCVPVDSKDSDQLVVGTPA